jgi:O-antigen/teichoic acid export membrane protein
MRRDVLSAYAASAAKILSWVIVSGLLYRYIDIAEFAMLALVRGTIGILNYTSFGLSPAMIRIVAERKTAPTPQGGSTLSYYAPAPSNLRSLYANSLIIALISGAAAIALTLAYAAVFTQIYRVPIPLIPTMPWVVLWIGIGTALRLMSDAPGSLLQAEGRIAADNYRLAEAEIVWVVLSIVLVARVGALSNDPIGMIRFLLRGSAMGAGTSNTLAVVAFCYALTGLLLLIRRAELARRLVDLMFPRWQLIDEVILKRLLAFGSLVLFAQLADYLYAPTDYILINHLLGWHDVAVYTPAMQIDAGLLLLVTGLSSVILPKTALAHSAGEMERVRRYYVYGTSFSAALLLFAGVVVWIASPLIFKLWLGDVMKPTQLILPLVLIHTIVGGSSAVGRSILLGMGKVRAFTIAVLIAGASNVALSYIFVAHLHLGLKGIIYGTIVAVVGRCAIWMPWYVLRSLRRAA